MFASLRWQSENYPPVLSTDVLQSKVDQSEDETTISQFFQSNNQSLGLTVDHVTEIELPKKPVLLLYNTLLPSECQLLIDLTEKMGFEDADKYCFAYNDRLNDRLMSDDLNLTDIIWERVKDHLPQTMTHQGKTVTLHSLNTRWRFCKYRSGHHFGIHTDGSFSNHKEGTTSLLTFMIYLNSQSDNAYTGGSTIFFDRTHQEKHRVAVPSGTAITFLQKDLDMLHSGEEVHSGVKYILRTDVMYSRKKRDTREDLM